MEPEALLHAIRADPDDETVRLVYADWLEEHGNPRSEFIRVQCELARLFDPVPRLDRPRDSEHARIGSEEDQLSNQELYLALKERERQLLTALEPAWVGPLWSLFEDWTTRRSFRRGFVESVRLSPREFTTHAPTLFEWCPLIRDLRIASDADHLAVALASPYMARVEQLDLGGYFWPQEDHLLALGSSPYLSQLKTLRLGDNLDEQDLQLLARAPWMSGLRTLVLECDSYLGDSPDRVAEVNRILGRRVCVVDPCN
jgi:uncharacterized protein (TIGR02996 family)